MTVKSVYNLLVSALTGKESDFTSGSIDRGIFLLAIPMMLEMVFEALFALFDMIFVTRLGTEAVATIGLTEVVLMIVESIALGIGMGATAMVSRRIGEGNRDGASLAAVQAIFLAVFISLISGVFFYYNGENVLRLMGGEESLITQGKTYTSIILGFNGTLFLLFVLNSLFRGAGDASIAMRTLIGCNILNIVLDACLIFGLGPFPELGLKGAAIATVIGRGVGVLYLFYNLFFVKNILQIKKEHLLFIPKLIVKLWSVSVGGIAQFIIATMSWLFIVKIIALYGSEAIAGYSISIRIIIFSILPAWGMATAVATLVGQNLGAGKPERAEQSVWRASRLNMIFLLGVSVIFFIIAPVIIPWFDRDPIVIREGVKGLRIILLGYLAYAYGMVIGQAFNGAGDTYTPTVINLVCFWFIQIPLAYILAQVVGLETTGVYWAIAISESILAVVAIWVFKKGRWKNIEI